jgi:hypothetical protein
MRCSNTIELRDLIVKCGRSIISSIRMLKGLLQMLKLFVHRPPRRARTRCRVAPPSSWYSFAVLSSFLYVRIISRVFVVSLVSSPETTLHVHLLATKDQTLLCWGNALLLLDTLLDARDLWVALCQPNCPGISGSCVLSWVAEGELCLKGGVVLCSRAQCRAQSPCRSGCALYKEVISC